MTIDRAGEGVGLKHSEEDRNGRFLERMMPVYETQSNKSPTSCAGLGASSNSLALAVDRDARLHCDFSTVAMGGLLDELPSRLGAIHAFKGFVCHVAKGNVNQNRTVHQSSFNMQRERMFQHLVVHFLITVSVTKPPKLGCPALLMHTKDFIQLQVSA